MSGTDSGGGQQRKEWKDADLLRQCLSQMDDPEMCQMMIKVLLPRPAATSGAVAAEAVQR
jgi:hypothetical protein